MRQPYVPILGFDSFYGGAVCETSFIHFLISFQEIYFFLIFIKVHVQQSTALFSTKILNLGESSANCRVVNG